MAGDRELNSLLGQQISLSSTEDEEVTEAEPVTEEDIATPLPENIPENPDMAPSVEPMGANARQGKRGKIQNDPSRDLSAFKRGFQEPFHSHFSSAEAISKKLGEFNMDPEVRDYIKPVMYELKRFLEDVTTETESLEYSVGETNLNNQVHKTFYSHFDTNKTDNRLNFLKLKIVYESLLNYNNIVRDNWEKFEEKLEPLVIHSKLRERLEDILANQVGMNKLLCEQTDFLLGKMKTYLTVTNEEHNEIRNTTKVTAEYHDSIHYSWEGFLASVDELDYAEPAGEGGNSERQKEEKSELGGLPGVSLEESPTDSIKSKIPKPLNASREDVEGLYGTLDKEPESKQKGRPDAGLDDDFEIQFAQPERPSVFPEFISLTEAQKKWGFLSAEPIGSKDWNTTPLYQMGVEYPDIVADEEKLKNAFKISTTKEDVYKRANMAAAMVRVGKERGKISEYNTLLKKVFTEIKERDIPGEFPTLPERVGPELLAYHIGPNVYYDIAVAKMKHGKYGFVSFLNEQGKPETNYPRDYIRGNLVIWWNQAFVNVAAEDVNFYIGYSKLREYMKESYYRDLEKAKQKHEEFSKKYGHKIANYNPARHFRAHWYNYFSPLKVHVYRRFVPNTIFSEAQ